MENEGYKPLYKDNDRYDRNFCAWFWEDDCPGDALYCEAWHEVKEKHRYMV
ncbi:MAG: hypothetical protein ACFFD4_02240 [Candidatus Odinarchaeota archaeon]